MSFQLTQLASIKARLGLLPADSTDDAILLAAIKAFSGRADRETRRTLARTAAAVEEFAGDEVEIRVACYPIESVATLHLKSNETDGWVIQTGVDYVIRRNCVVSLAGPMGTWRDQAKLTYTGGYVLPGTTPGAGQTALPDDLEQATVEQVSYWYTNRQRLGVVSMSTQGGSIQQFSQLDLLPNVKAILKRYERILA